MVDNAGWRLDRAQGDQTPGLENWVKSPKNGRQHSINNDHRRGGQSMKVIPARYRCEICHTDYSTPEEALECESRPIPNYPIGMIYGNNVPGSVYEHIVFAVAAVKVEKHWAHISNWACRGGKYRSVGDNLKDILCGHCGYSRLTRHDAQLDKDSPEFKRMVESLKSKNIPITIWDGEKPVPYEG